MKNKVKLRELTPKHMKCAIGACPAIFEVTPKHMKCCISACPAIFKDGKEKYFVIGKKVNPKKLGIANKVGKDEVLIEVPKALIDEKEK